MRKCIVIIPVYKLDLIPEEQLSLENNLRCLSGHPVCFVSPDGLDLTELTERYPQCMIERFDARYFKDIDGYNELLYSPEFYERFCSYTYMLICQLDVYVFSDQLNIWCEKGFDYVGAPWLPQRKPYYLSRTGQCYLSIKRKILTWRGLYHNKRFYFQVGNGGFSLRKTATFITITKTLQDQIIASKDKKGKFLYEDIFYSLHACNHLPVLIPGYREALAFSFEQNPPLAFELNNRQLPFGCHAWYKEPMAPFWKQYIK